MQRSVPLLNHDYLRVKRCRHGFFAYNVNDAAVGRSLDIYGEWCERELMLLGELVQPGDVVVDVGANIGTHTLFFSKAVGAGGQVVAFEPQLHAHNLLVTNVALNCVENVYAYRMALGDRACEYVFPRLDPRVAQNFGMVNAAGSGDGDRVTGTTVDSFETARCNLIKIDVEGMEERVIDGARTTLANFRPLLYLENDRPANSPGLIAKLEELGYRCWWHLSPYFNPDNYFENRENGYGALLSVNMLALPEESPLVLPPGLERARAGDVPADAVRRVHGDGVRLEDWLVFAGAS